MVSDSVISDFTILDVVDQIIMKHHIKVTARVAGFAVLMGILSGFSCEDQIKRDKNIMKVIDNTFFNNKSKDSTDNVSKDKVICL